ncbi:hypothetical protein ACFC00_38715 [Streptomyces adustus]|uniref:hypothetical protein n=1 Tax=Streptomyces adustus TaxID=1609272 RepID=UPI0035DEF524
MGEPLQELVQGGLSVVDCEAFVISQRDVGQHLLEVLLCLQKMTLAGLLGHVEVTAGTGHAVWALLEERVRAAMGPTATTSRRTTREQPEIPAEKNGTATSKDSGSIFDSGGSDPSADAPIEIPEPVLTAILDPNHGCTYRFGMKWCFFGVSTVVGCVKGKSVFKEVLTGALKDLSGYTDLINCKNGSWSGCAWTVVNGVGYISVVGKGVFAVRGARQVAAVSKLAKGGGRLHRQMLMSEKPRLSLTPSCPEWSYS